MRYLNRVLIGIVGGVSVIIAGALIVVHAAQSPQSAAKRNSRHKTERYRQTQQYKNEVNREWLRTRIMEGSSVQPARSFDASKFDGKGSRRDHPMRMSATAPPSSPGQVIGFTSYDFQSSGSQGHNVARTPSGTKIHFTWMSFKDIPLSAEEYARHVVYTSYVDPYMYPVMIQSTPYGGVEITDQVNRGGHCEVDVDASNHAQVALHKAENDYLTEAYKPWHYQFPFNSSDLFQPFKLSGYDTSCPEQTVGRGGVLWPRITSDRSNMILHEIAHSNIFDCPDHKLWYWRFNGTAWEGPALVSNTPENRYVLAADATSDKVAIVTYASPVGDYWNVEYIESQNDGLDWLALVPNVDPLPTPIPITSYGPPGTESVWNNLTTSYDNAGVLHVMFDVQDTGTTHVSIKHWNSARGTIRTVTYADWDNPMSSGIGNLNLANLSMGIGDGSTMCDGGSNSNYVYATYVQFGGFTQSELDDYSSEYSYEGRLGGYMNGEVYLTISNSGGNTWSPSVNLTNSKTPGCNPGLADPQTGVSANPDSVCRSENWATIGRVVKDIDVFFVSDLDPGAIPYGEGSWQLNPVHYLQISGSGIAPAGVCPATAPVFAATLGSDPLREYTAPRYGSATATLTIQNLGNDTLDQGSGPGIIVTGFPGLPTLTLDDPSGSYSIPDGDPDLIRTVTMASNGAEEGLYQGEISVSHNDPNPSNLNPRVFPIEFFVFDQFYSTESAFLKTGAPGPGSLKLLIGSDGRFASGQTEGGLWRHSDSSSSIFDASLLLAYGPQGPDTTVFHRFYNRQSNGQNGFRPQSELWIDTMGSARDGQPYRIAGAYMTTRDSVMGINMSWYFPQNPDADEAVIVNYQIFPGPHYLGSTITDVATGLIADFNVYPAQRPPLDTAQIDATNLGLADGFRNLAYMRGVNRQSYYPTPTNTTLRFRAGVAVPSSSQFGGAFIGNNMDNQVGGGPTDSWLYALLQNVGGFVEIAEVVDTDLYIMVGFDKDQSYNMTGTTWQNSDQQYRATNTSNFTAVFASDTTDDASFKTTIDQAAALVNAGTFEGCAVCPCRYDPTCDGFPNVTDVVEIVNGAFRNVTPDPAILGGPGTDDDHANQAGCNFDSRDVDADGVIGLLDVTKMINVVFRNYQLNAPNTFVDPCTRWKEWVASQY